MGSGCSQPALGGSAPLCLSTGSNLLQTGGEVAGSSKRIVLIVPGWPNMLWYWDVVAMSSQIPLFLPNQSTQPSQESVNLNLHAWLLEPQLSRSMAALRQWWHKLRLLKESQPDKSMRQVDHFYKVVPQQSGELQGTSL